MLVNELWEYQNARCNDEKKDTKLTHFVKPNGGVGSMSFPLRVIISVCNVGLLGINHFYIIQLSV